MKSKQKLRKLVCLVLCVLLLLSNFTFAQTAPVSTDIKGHWAEKQINEWISKGYISTYKDGSFKPNTGITRAELASVVNKAFSFTEKDTTNFKDVNAKDSFYNDMAIAKKAGYLKGDAAGNANPTSFMTRQEFAVIMQRLMKLDNPSTIKAINAFKDANKIPSWSKDAIESIVASGYMVGNPDKTFNPKGTVTRAETITTLDRIYLHFIRVTYDKAGEYNAETVNGSVAINVPNVTLQNTVINGDLIIGKGVGEGNVNLKNVTIKGDTIVKGGGMNSIVVENCTLGHIIIIKEGNMVRVVAVGSTTTGSVDMQSGGKLEESGTTGDGFGYVTIAESVDDGTPISLIGNFETIEVQGSGINLDLTSGSAGSIDIAETATNTNLNIGTGATVSSLTLAAPTTLAGTGTVTSATVEGSNVTLGVTGTTTIAQLDVAATATNSSINLDSGSTITNITVDSAASITGTGSIGTAEVNVAGTTITAPTTNISTPVGVTVATTPAPTPTPTPTAPSTDDGGGSHNNVIKVSAIAVTGTGNVSTITMDNGTLQMLAAVTPTNATNNTVTWSVTNGTGAASISSTGLLNAISDGTVTVKAAANDGSEKFGTKEITISNQVPTILFSSARIANGAANPDIVVNIMNDTFTASDISTLSGSWTASVGTTGLSVGSITRNSNTQITFHMNGTAQPGALTLKAKAAALADGAESNTITVFVLAEASGAAGTIEKAEYNNGVVDEEPAINGQDITFNGEVAYYLSTESNPLPKSGNWVGVKITAPEGISPDDTSVLYINGRNLNLNEEPGWDNIREEGDGDNYFHLFQRITDLSRDYNITIKWNNSLTESYMIDFAETATLEGAHGAIELAHGINGGANAIATINGMGIRFDGEIEYIEADESNGLPVSGNWVGVKITAPEGVYPDENAVLTAHGINCNRDGLPGWENIWEEGDGDNYFYLYQRVRQTAYVYEIEIKWNNDSTETYEIIIPGSTTLEYSESELIKLGDIIGAAQDFYNNALDYGNIDQTDIDNLGGAIADAQAVYDKDGVTPQEIYAAQTALSSAIDAFWDAYQTEIAAVSDNIAINTTYTDEDPLNLSLNINGIGDFVTDNTDYITLGGALSGMEIKSITFEGDPANIAVLELTGTTGDTGYSIYDGAITIEAGGVNGHSHGFDSTVVPIGTIEQSETMMDGGENATATVDGQTIIFTGEIAYYVADETNGLPESGNYVGVKITAHEGVVPDENAVLTEYGAIETNGWTNIKKAGDGDNYFHFYQRIPQKGFVYEVKIKWNNDITETYFIMIPGAATLEAAPPDATAISIKEGHEEEVAGIRNDEDVKRVAVFYPLTVGGLKNAIEAADGSTQTYEVTDSSGNVKTDDMKLDEGDNLTVTSQDGSLSETYSIRVFGELIIKAVQKDGTTPVPGAIVNLYNEDGDIIQFTDTNNPGEITSDVALGEDGEEVFVINPAFYRCVISAEGYNSQEETFTFIISEITPTITVVLLTAAETADAIAKIETYNAADNADAMTIAELKATGVTGVVDENLEAYKAAIAGAETGAADTLEEIQAIVDRVNSIAVIEGYNAADNAYEMTIAELIAAGATDLIDGCIGAYQVAIAEAETGATDTTEEIQAIVDAVNASAIALRDAITAEIGEDHANPEYVLTEADYTAESWEAYTDMIAMAIDVEADQGATQGDFDNKVEQIGEAKLNLEFAGQAALNSAKEEATAKVSTDYTAESWAVLTNALELAETTNALVVAKTEAIMAAIEALVPLEG